MANTRTNDAKLRQVDLATVSAKVSERKRPTVVVTSHERRENSARGPDRPVLPESIPKIRNFLLSSLSSTSYYRSITLNGNHHFCFPEYCNGAASGAMF